MPIDGTANVAVPAFGGTFTAKRINPWRSSAAKRSGVSDDPWPGWIEVALTDGSSRVWRLFDKPPIFGGAEQFSKLSAFPVDVTVRVAILQPGDDAGIDIG